MVSFLFFKQKTAYEMRISDWSSDVCSSDLHDRRDFGGSSSRHCSARERVLLPERRPHGPDPADYGGYPRYPRRPRPNGAEARAAEAAVSIRKSVTPEYLVRSEEHTSELQSLMRNSYAVFCLKKHNNLDTNPP